MRAWARPAHSSVARAAAAAAAAARCRRCRCSSDCVSLFLQVDPELLATFDKLGIPLGEQKRLANVAVDAVFDSVSIATTFREELGKVGGQGDFPGFCAKGAGVSTACCAPGRSSGTPGCCTCQN